MFHVVYSFNGRETFKFCLTGSMNCGSKDKPLPADPNFFILQRLRDMYFQVGDIEAPNPDNGVATMPIHHLAGLAPWSCWNGPASHVVWNMKWSPAKGFVPVRPVILSKCEIKVPAEGSAASAVPGGPPAADDV